jgi:tetratricopeptide (TPR) repeat protein
MYKFILFSTLLLSHLLLISCGGKSANKQTATSKKENLDSLLKIDPNNVDLLVKRGNKYLATYKFYDALTDGAKAYRLDSNNLEARFLYANALNNRADRTQVDIENAKQHFLYLIKRQPGNKKIYVSLASSYTQQGDFEKSFQYINEALRIDKKYRDAYILKGTNYLSLGNRKLAKSSYETAIQQDTKFFEGYLYLGYLYSEDNDPLAVEYFRTAATLRPTSTDALYGVAYNLQIHGKLEEALKAYRELLQVDQKFYLALFNEGYIKQFEQNQLDSAIYYYTSAIELQPKFVKGWHNLGLCYASLGRKPEALNAFATALKYNPKFEISRIEANKLK